MVIYISQICHCKTIRAIMRVQDWIVPRKIRYSKWILWHVWKHMHYNDVDWYVLMLISHFKTLLGNIGRVHIRHRGKFNHEQLNMSVIWTKTKGKVSNPPMLVIRIATHTFSNYTTGRFIYNVNSDNKSLLLWPHLQFQHTCNLHVDWMFPFEWLVMDFTPPIVLVLAFG